MGSYKRGFRRRTIVAVVVAIALLAAGTACFTPSRAHLRAVRCHHHICRRPTTTTAGHPTTTHSTTSQPGTTTTAVQGSTTTLNSTTTTAAPVTTTTAGGAVGDTKPISGGFFQLQPPGTAFPTDAQCAAEVHQSTWEPRPQNTVANHTAPVNPQLLANFSQWSATWNSTYKPRIDGNFQGTTDEIIQWAACKWGWSDDVIRAEAIVESSWVQSTAGDAGNSFGSLQIKWNYHPAGPAKGAVGSSWPNSANSTAYAIDQQVAEMRGCYDGMSTYLGNTTGDIWGCLQSWYSGAWTAGGGSYANSVKTDLNSKPWLSWAG